jgi:hypothetical protein
MGLDERIKTGMRMPSLLRIGTGQLGCCFFPGPLLVFYDLKEETLEPVGSAIVATSRGALQSARVMPSR